MTFPLGIVAAASGPLAGFTDNFTGTGSLDSRWTSTTGTWSQGSGDASTVTAASSTPLATFFAKTDKVSVRAEPGTTNTFGWGAAFWVVDASNWWAVLADRTTFTCQTGTTTGCCACGDNGCGPDGGCNCYSCAGGGCIPPCTFVGNAGTCSYPVFGTCYSYRITLLRSVSGTVTEMGSAEIASSTSASLSIGYVQAVTNSAGQITATGQMSTGGTVAQIQQTPTATKASRHGMLLRPATNGTQGTSFELFTYSPQ